MGFGIVSTVSVAFTSWVPSFLMHGYGMTAPRAGAVLGLLLLAAGILGSITGGLATGWLTRRGRTDAALLIVLAGVAVMMLCATLAPLMSSAASCLALYGMAFCAFGLASGPSLAAIQTAVPLQLCGRIAALYYLTVNILAQSLGPILVPSLTGLLGGRLDLALSCTSLGWGLWVWAC